VNDSYTKRYNYSTDAATFCKNYHSDKLFARMPGLEHTAYRRFILDSSVTHQPRGA